MAVFFCCLFLLQFRRKKNSRINSKNKTSRNKKKNALKTNFFWRALLEKIILHICATRLQLFFTLCDSFWNVFLFSVRTFLVKDLKYSHVIKTPVYRCVFQFYTATKHRIINHEPHTVRGYYVLKDGKRHIFIAYTRDNARLRRILSYAEYHFASLRK